MKKVDTILFVIIYSALLFSQSSIVFESGTTIEVTGGADICADEVVINGSHSGDGTICFDNPLPVELIIFTANLIYNKIELKWQTATEINNYGFEIERKNNQQGETYGEYKKIGFVEGFGNSNSIKNYSFKDNNLSELNGKIYYRLKQIDTDGLFTYSNELIVEIFSTDLPTEFALFQNYPNPFNPSTEIRYQIAEDINVSLIIYDVLGNEVAVLINEYKKAGKYSVQFNGAAIPSGVYFYRLQANNFIETKKLLLIK